MQEKDAPRKRFEEIAEHIELLIFSGRLVVGDKIPSERELMERFGVGPVPLSARLSSHFSGRVFSAHDRVLRPASRDRPSKQWSTSFQARHATYSAGRKESAICSTHVHFWK